jgi:thiamine-phosphate pyrophosphorylase
MHRRKVEAATNPPATQPLHFKLYAITDRALCAPRTLYDTIHDLLDVGVSAIQLREKDLTDAEYIRLAEPLCKLCHAYSAQLFINSRIKIAMSIGADGLHLPGDSASVQKVIEQTNGRFIIGSSVHTLTEAKQRETEGADFITYSPIYPTLSKPDYGPAVGVAGLQNITEGVNIPVFALGGITPERVSECLDVGAYGVAVMSGVMSPKNGVQQAKVYLQQLLK